VTAEGPSPCRDALPLLLAGASFLGLTLENDTLDRFAQYCAFLLKRNESINLTGVRSPQGVMTTLCLDSLTVLAALPTGWRSAPLSVVDVGAGAGIPGIPLKIACLNWKLTMIESIGKKARFLGDAVEVLGLQDVTVLAQRAEEAGMRAVLRDSADLCLARAVAPLPVLIELCSPFVRPGGRLLFPKSGDVGSEIGSAVAAERALRIQRAGSFAVPEELGLGSGREIVVYEKVGPTPSDFPRRIGLARKDPIH
jgi:16S rRNA (guanine527-N7)-methyltransferase